MSEVGVWIYGDQVYREASSLVGVPKSAPIVFVESIKFCSRRPYHWQKIVLIFSAMRHFAEELRKVGREVHYYELAEDFAASLKHFVDTTGIETLRVMEPNDHDRFTWTPIIEKKIGCTLEVTPDNQFLCSHDEFADWAYGKKSLTMEFFYREMRRKLGVLLDPAGQPVGGKWNLDKLNRVGHVPELLPIPEPIGFEPDTITRKVIEDVARVFGEQCFGATDAKTMQARFRWPVTPKDSHKTLDFFLKKLLADFGPYEDAMSTRSWSLWHSHLSVPLNCGLLHPQEIVDKTLAFAEPLLAKEKIPLNSVEGFLRQVIGWREFIRGIYWREMTSGNKIPYTHRNELGATRPLPDFYWTGDTDMRCLRESVTPVIEHGMSHHITRLMVLSNFALLHGINPQQVNEWFIYAYADGYEWVTTPNVVGMSLYADGGIVGTKPYAAGGAYINRMSDYCTGCRYNPTKSTGPDACPFTRAYWPFLHKHKKRLQSNPRTSLAVRGVDKISAAELNKRKRETDEWFETLKPFDPEEYK